VYLLNCLFSQEDVNGVFKGPGTRFDVLVYLSLLFIIPLILGLTFREAEKCRAFQESLSSDITGIRHINQLDLAKVDNFISQVINCKGHLYISGIGK